MKKIIALTAALMIFTPQVQAAGDAVELPKQDWSFNGPFGTFDRSALQRGFQVYKEVCAACHGMRHLAYRNLQDIGLSELQVKAVAAEYTVVDGPNDEGDMFDRPALPSDRFVGPYENEAQGRSANNGAFPPDLSLMTKARMHGSDYMYALMTGYTDKPFDLQMGPGMYYNSYFPGQQIAMPAPLVEGQISYADGTEATVDQMARDVSTFLTWAAEPHMEARKRMGAKVILFLVVFAGIMYVTKKKIWADVE